MSEWGYLFIAGGGMSRWVWRDLDPGIRSCAVLVPGRLPDNSLHARLHATMKDCVDHIEAQTLEARYDRYLIVGHSGGGMLAPLVAARMRDRIGGIAFVSANIPRDGTNALHDLPLVVRVLNMAAMRKHVNVDCTPARSHEKIIRKVFCNTASEEVIQYVLGQQLLTEPLCVYKEPVRWTGVPRIPMTFVRLLADRTISVKMQDVMASHLGVSHTIDIESDHMVMLSHPAAFNDALRKAMEAAERS
jgi:pimeloyl-ACP methyl ester carboxylesterase